MSTNGLCLERGHGVCVVSAAAGDGTGQQFRLEEPALAALLARPGVAERRAVVVSVAGAFRGGKSFLLDYMLRYLYAQAGAPGEDWLGGEQEPLRGFSWRNGSARDTTGLVLWSQPVPLTLPSGEQVVVLLMDTQGAFDEQSSLRDSSLIFALSTLLASVQIYNVSRRLDECDLQHLQISISDQFNITGPEKSTYFCHNKGTADVNDFSCIKLFTEYAALGGVVLQDLQVLVRDWTAPYEYAYGPDGGAVYLKHKLQIREEQPQESREVRERLMSSFERVDCFLLPHPGLKAASDPHFRGELADLTEEFKQSLRELVPLLLAPERLRPKAVDGQPLRAGELAVFLRAYLAEFRDRVPSPQTALAATAKARWATAAAAARAALCAPVPRRALPRARLRAHLDAACRAALAPLAPLAERAHESAALAQLEEELQALVEQQVEANARALELAAARARGGFERAARALLADASLCLHPRDLPPRLRAARDAARDSFGEDVESPEEDTDLAELLEELEEIIGDVLPRLEAANSARNAAGVAAARAAAAGALAPRPCAPAAALRAAHDAARAAAMAVFREARSAPTAHLDDPYLSQLENLIAEDLRLHALENEANNRGAVDAALQCYEQGLDLATGCWHPARLAARHAERAGLARDHLRRSRGDAAEDDYTSLLETGLSERYRVLFETNETRNEEAIELGYHKFCETMDSSCGFMQLSAEVFAEYLDNALRAGRTEFYRHRALGSRQSEGEEDIYYNQLNQRIELRFDHYHEQNGRKLTKMELASVLLNLTTVVVVTVATAGAGAAAAAGAGGAAAAGAELAAATRVPAAALSVVSTVACVFKRWRESRNIPPPQF